MKKIVEMIYCHPLNFCSFLKMLLFFMKIEWNKRSADGGMFGNSLCAQNATESVLFFCLILLVLCCTEGLYERQLLECTVNIWFLLKCLYYGLWKINWYRHPIWNFKILPYHCSKDVVIGYKKWWMDGQAESNMILQLFLCAHAILCTWLRPSLHKSKLQSHELNIMR